MISFQIGSIRPVGTGSLLLQELNDAPIVFFSGKSRPYHEIKLVLLRQTAKIFL
jgi:hypothetical protein